MLHTVLCYVKKLSDVTISGRISVFDAKGTGFNPCWSKMIDVVSYKGEGAPTKPSLALCEEPLLLRKINIVETECYTQRFAMKK